MDLFQFEGGNENVSEVKSVIYKQIVLTILSDTPQGAVNVHANVF